METRAIDTRDLYLLRITGKGRVPEVSAQQRIALRSKCRIYNTQQIQIFKLHHWKVDQIPFLYKYISYDEINSQSREFAK